MATLLHICNNPVEKILIYGEDGVGVRMAVNCNDDISTGNSSCEEMRVSDVHVYRREAIHFSLSRFDTEH